MVLDESFWMKVFLDEFFFCIWMKVPNLRHRPVRGGKIPKGKLLERFTDFSQGRWIQMLINQFGLR